MINTPQKWLLIHFEFDMPALGYPRKAGENYYFASDNYS